jgi:alkaline phosphatase D
MNRRGFLHATLVTVGSLMAPIGCSDDDDSSAPATTCTPVVDEAIFPQSVASGDPTPESVILWTRVEDASADDLHLTLEVATDEAFTEIFQVNGAASVMVMAEAQFDHCAKVRLEGLSPATTYYYRFTFTNASGCFLSRVGRTKTAPARDADVKVKFAFVSCQDYIGRYYNTYLALAQQDIDFVVHLGDYIYETTGDPSFQSTTGRTVKFDDEAGAIALTTGAGETYYAAKSIDNYRQLYKTYRADKALQAIHERFAMIAIWDDHEFSDDCHGAVGTYYDGKQDETDETRRKAADQVWFEHMPVDYLGDPAFRYDASVAFPKDIKIHRDFVFGKHVHLVMTNERSYRADHLIPEEGFPGKVVVDEAALIAAFGALPASAAPYVDVDTFQGGAYKTVLTGGAATLGFDAANVTGNLSVAWINGVVEALADPVGPIDDTDPTLKKGIAYIDAGKGSYNSSIGSRYLVVKEPFDILSQLSYQTTSGASADVLGAEQEAWFIDTMSTATETWKIWGNEYCLLPLQIDISSFPVPESFQNAYYMNVDAWDGFRDKRDEILAKLVALDNVVAITGDIHAFYAGIPGLNSDPSQTIVELVTSSISSGSFKSLLESQVKSDPVLSAIPLAAQLAGQIDNLLTSKDTMINPHLAYANSKEHGFAVVEADGTELLSHFHQIKESEVSTDYTGKETELLALFKVTTFRVLPGDKNLYKLADDGTTFQQWDPATLSYI